MSELVKNNVLSSPFFSELKEEHLFDVSDTQKNYRQSNWESLQKLEFPTTRDEYWKYTRLGKVVKQFIKTPPKLPNLYLLLMLKGLRVQDWFSKMEFSETIYLP